MSDDEYQPNSFNATLARVEAKIDIIVQNNAVLSAKVESQERRISKLEAGRAWLVGAAAGAAFALKMLWDALKGQILKP